MTWLLCDYGEVISLPQPPADRLALEEEAGRSGQEFWDAYWRHRPDYDRGRLAAADYWTAVLGLRPDRAKRNRLVELDVAGWLHTNADTLSAASRAARRGLNLAILSNAPNEVADAIDATGFAGIFTPRLFSCRLGTIKPDHEAFLLALKALDVEASEVTFFDDRLVNVTAATEVGMLAYVFTGPAQIDAVLTEPMPEQGSA